MPPPDRLSSKQAAALLGMSESWMQKRRQDGAGPPWHRLPGTRRVYYIRAELEAWVMSEQAPKKEFRPITWADLGRVSTDGTQWQTTTEHEDK